MLANVNFSCFREWSGELRYVQNITLRRIKDKDGKTKDSVKSKELNESEMEKAKDAKCGESSATGSSEEKSS